MCEWVGGGGRSTDEIVQELKVQTLKAPSENVAYLSRLFRIVANIMTDVSF